MAMVLTLICFVVLVISLATILWKKRNRDQLRTMEQHAISPEQLYSLLGSSQDVALFDVRQPLDLLAHSEIIPGARRIPPLDVLAVPSLIPKDKEAIVYCTCPGDKTSLAVLRRALDLKAASKLGKRRAIRSSHTGRFFTFIHPTLVRCRPLNIPTSDGHKPLARCLYQMLIPHPMMTLRQGR